MRAASSRARRDTFPIASHEPGSAPAVTLVSVPHTSPRSAAVGLHVDRRRRRGRLVGSRISSALTGWLGLPL